MAYTEYYVDPGAGNDTTGDGSVIAPWQTVQKALNTITRNSTNGDRINVKAGTADVLSATLSAATYGTPATQARLVIQGYTSTAGDGGIGEISGGGTYSVWNDTSKDYIIFADLHVHSSGSNPVLRFDDDCSVIRCEVDNTTNSGIVMDNHGTVVGCHIHNCGAHGITHNYYNGTIEGNALFDGTNTFSYGIYVQNNTFVTRNIIYLTGNGSGVWWYSNGGILTHNSILSSGGSGKGVVTADRAYMMYNNVVEGFSGAGGCGFDFGYADDPAFFIGNVSYNNTTHFDSNTYTLWTDDNQTAGSSPFAKSGSATFANRLAYFAPADVADMRTGAFLGNGVLSKGAVQYVVAGGGGGSSFTGIRAASRGLRA